MCKISRYILLYDWEKNVEKVGSIYGRLMGRGITTVMVVMWADNEIIPSFAWGQVMPSTWPHLAWQLFRPSFSMLNNWNIKLISIAITFCIQQSVPLHLFPPEKAPKITEDNRRLICRPSNMWLVNVNDTSKLIKGIENEPFNYICLHNIHFENSYHLYLYGRL